MNPYENTSGWRELEDGTVIDSDGWHLQQQDTWNNDQDRVANSRPVTGYNFGGRGYKEEFTIRQEDNRPGGFDRRADGNDEDNSQNEVSDLTNSGTDQGDWGDEISERMPSKRQFSSELT